MDSDASTEHQTAALRRAKGSLSRLEDLVRLYRADERIDTDYAVQLSRELLAAGGALQAQEFADAEMKRGPVDPLLAHTYALALARLGAVERAYEVLKIALARCEATAAPPEVRSEVLSALARTHKDLAFALTDPTESARHLSQALGLYSQAYWADHSVHSGVNVAALALIGGDTGFATEVATTVAAEAERRLTGVAPEARFDDRYWLLATIAECHLILGDHSRACSNYRSASLYARSQRRLGDLATTRRQALRLGRARGLAEGVIDEWLPPPHVLVFSGHRFDGALRASPRLPIAWESALAADLAASLDDDSVVAGFASLSIGADLLFVEWLLSHDREVHLVLPVDDTSYLRALADERDGVWRDRIEQCVRRATSVTVASPKSLEATDADYRYTNDLLMGLAMNRADELGGQLRGVAVWSVAPSEGVGGTACAIGGWIGHGIPIRVLVPRAPDRPSAAAQALAPEIAAACVEGREVTGAPFAFLFADFKGFSRLEERLVRSFVEVVMGAVAAIAQRHDAAGSGPITRNTWGDGLFLVFDHAHKAARLALEISEWMKQAQGELRRVGLPPDLSVRIALHAGPATAIRDPVTGQPSFFGAHVSHAARLEPATPPALVYCSSAFAAMLALEPAAGIAARHVGKMEWSKGHGVHPTFRVVRSAG